jgi:hypothetical protein
MLPGGAAATAAVMAPVEAHLAAHPGDWVGAQALLLEQVLGSPVGRDAGAFAAARADAESPPVVVDTPSHEVYLQAPGVLAGLVGNAPRGSAG